MRIFVDTNILVYTEDPREVEKQQLADDVLTRLADEVDLFASAQVVSEMANTLLRLKVSPVTVIETIDGIERAFQVVPVTPDIVRAALKGVSRFGFSFYDAQIWAAAREWGAEIVLSEDFTDGLVADGVRFVNPFAQCFDAEAFLGSLSS